MTDNMPDVIYLLPHDAEYGTHSWCDHIPSCEHEIDAIKYIRADLVETTTEERQAALDYLIYAERAMKSGNNPVGPEPWILETLRNSLQAKTVPMSLLDELESCLSDYRNGSHLTTSELNMSADEVLNEYNNFKRLPPKGYVECDVMACNCGGYHKKVDDVGV